MNLRPANASDAAAFAALIMSHRALLTLDPEGRGAEQFFESVSTDALRDYLESDRYTYTVAEGDGEILGFIGIRDRSHLFHLFVSSDHQGKGIGRRLWDNALRVASEQSNAVPFTVNSSLNAVPVYRRFGFVEAAPRVDKHEVAFLPMRRQPA